MLLSHRDPALLPQPADLDLHRLEDPEQHLGDSGTTGDRVFDHLEGATPVTGEHPVEVGLRQLTELAGGEPAARPDQGPRARKVLVDPAQLVEGEDRGELLPNRVDDLVGGERGRDRVQPYLLPLQVVGQQPWHALGEGGVEGHQVERDHVGHRLRGHAEGGGHVSTELRGRDRKRSQRRGLPDALRACPHPSRVGRPPAWGGGFAMFGTKGSPAARALSALPSGRDRLSRVARWEPPGAARR